MQSSVIQKVKPWMLPIAMTVGAVFHSYMEYAAFLAPYLIFVMLLVTYCKVDLRHFGIGRPLWLLLGVQLLLSGGAYFACLPLGTSVAQGVFICIFCPTATAAPVITSMLGGNLARLVAFSLLSNAMVALLAPLLFSVIGGTDLPLAEGTLLIARRVVPLILAPLALALLLKHTVPGVHRTLAEHQSLSFYIWSVSLIIVVGRAVSFVMSEPPSAIPTELLLAGGALLACLAQFGIGRLLGRRFGDPVSAAQGLGQKNTVLAIWMALTYLSPLSSVAPAAYVLWQNTINSLQLYMHNRTR